MTRFRDESGSIDGRDLRLINMYISNSKRGQGMRHILNSALRPMAFRLMAACICGCLPGVGSAAAPLPPVVCGGTSDCSQQVATGAQIKWNPGHYVLAPTGNTVEQDKAIFDEIANEPAIKGVHFRYYWKDLEPTFNGYQFARVDAVLEKAKATNKHVILEIWTQSYWQTLRPSPAYIQTDKYGGGDYSANGATEEGYGSRIWNVEVMNRLIALYQAFGARYNASPNFEAVSTHETALGPAVRDLPDFSVVAATSQYQRLMAAARKAWPNTIVRLGTNWWHSEAPFVTLHEGSVPNMYGLGGPDTLASKPPELATTSQKIIVGALGGFDYRGVVPIMFNVESNDVGASLPRDLYDKAAYDLKVTHMSWLRNTWAGTAEQRWDTGILPFLRSINGYLPNTACPTSMAGRCVTKQ